MNEKNLANTKNYIETCKEISTLYNKKINLAKNIAKINTNKFTLKKTN